MQPLKMFALKKGIGFRHFLLNNSDMEYVMTGLGQLTYSI